jgi:hypothetical protein
LPPQLTISVPEGKKNHPRKKTLLFGIAEEDPPKRR